MANAVPGQVRGKGVCRCRSRRAVVPPCPCPVAGPSSAQGCGSAPAAGETGRASPAPRSEGTRRGAARAGPRVPGSAPGEHRARPAVGRAVCREGGGAAPAPAPAAPRALLPARPSGAAPCGETPRGGPGCQEPEWILFWRRQPRVLMWAGWSEKRQIFPFVPSCLSQRRLSVPGLVIRTRYQFVWLSSARFSSPSRTIIAIILLYHLDHCSIVVFSFSFSPCNTAITRSSVKLAGCRGKGRKEGEGETTND